MASTRQIFSKDPYESEYSVMDGKFVRSLGPNQKTILTNFEGWIRSVVAEDDGANIVRSYEVLESTEFHPVR